MRADTCLTIVFWLYPQEFDRLADSVLLSRVMVAQLIEEEDEEASCNGLSCH